MHHLLRAWAIVNNERGRVTAGEFYDPIQTYLGVHKEDGAFTRALGQGYVYYAQLRHGDIKIGYSAVLWQRIKQLRLARMAVLAIEPGYMELEKLRHRQFARLRHGRSEDFDPAPDLLSHVEMIRAHYGAPCELVPLTP